MANTIALAKKYLSILDELYKKEMVTSVLEAPNELVREGATASSILIPKITLDGLGDYDRSTGYPEGDVTFEWEEHSFSNDRAVKLTVDRQDNLESLDTAFAALSGQFVRTKVAPEIDAFRFAELASSAHSDNVTNADIDNSNTVEAIGTAIVALDEAEVPEEGRYLFVTPQVYSNIRNSDLFDRSINDVGDRSIPTYDGMPVIKVPQSRFYTGITLNDGSSSFGFAKTTGGTEYEINFMIVHEQAALPIVKQNGMKIFEPEENQNKDAWAFNYRLYHEAFTPDNKTKGIYVHTKGTAIA